jgi:hypothetical protein
MKTFVAISKYTLTHALINTNRDVEINATPAEVDHMRNGKHLKEQNK